MRQPFINSDHIHAAAQDAGGYFRYFISINEQLASDATREEYGDAVRAWFNETVSSILHIKLLNGDLVSCVIDAANKYTSYRLHDDVDIIEATRGTIADRKLRDNERLEQVQLAYERIREAFPEKKRELAQTIISRIEKKVDRELHTLAKNETINHTSSAPPQGQSRPDRIGSSRHVPANITRRPRRSTPAAATGSVDVIPVREPYSPDELKKIKRVHRSTRRAVVALDTEGIVSAVENTLSLHLSGMMGWFLREVVEKHAEYRLGIGDLKDVITLHSRIDRTFGKHQGREIIQNIEKELDRHFASVLGQSAAR